MRLSPFLDPLIPGASLLLLLIYTYASFWTTPYVGFEWNPADGTIVNLWVVREPGPRLGDRVLSIGAMSFSAFQADLRRTISDSDSSGVAIPLVVERAGQTLTLAWTMPGLNGIEVRERIFSQWWLAWLFWIFALLTYLLLRPRDTRWRLLTAFHSLTALWLMASGLSRWHTWESAIILRIAIWLCIPIYWHLHWLHPQPLSRLPRAIWAGVYGLAIALAIAQWFQWLPASLYGLGFLMALIGVVVPVTWRLRLPEHRTQARTLLRAALLAIGPPIVFTLLAVLSVVSIASATSLLPLPILPLFYFYAAYRRQLGNLEVRANRLISVYLFLTLLVLLASVFIPLVTPAIQIEGGSVVLGVAAVFVGGLIALLVFAPFQRLVERHLLGIPETASQLLETYSQRIAICANHGELVTLLRDELLPGLLVRQSALLLLNETTSPQLLYETGLSPGERPTAADIAELSRDAGQYRLTLNDRAACPWARVVVPLTVNWQMSGLWMLGRRDPDDFYSQTEINVLQSLASQTAVALTNILQAEQLRQLYRANIDQREAEQTRLARDLHDQVLNQMAVLRTSLGADQAPPEFRHAYADVVASLRQTIGDLRPAMLDYGLFSALKALADDLADRAGAQPRVVLAVPVSSVRYDPHIEQHLYRIIQQACANALQHAQAQTIRIDGVIEPHGLDLRVEDDGRGFDVEARRQMGESVARRHFGLAGMQERAALINAHLLVDTAPGRGTRVRVSWNVTS